MKYTKLFNNHSEYVAYTASTAFIRPNVSYCILEDEPHCTPSDLCQEGHTYEVTSTTYPQTVAASATSFDLSFEYNDIYTVVTCEQTTTTGSSTAIIDIEENPTTSARTMHPRYMMFFASFSSAFSSATYMNVPAANSSSVEMSLNDSSITLCDMPVSFISLALPT